MHQKNGIRVSNEIRQVSETSHPFCVADIINNRMVCSTCGHLNIFGKRCGEIGQFWVYVSVLFGISEPNGYYGLRIHHSYSLYLLVICMYV